MAHAESLNNIPEFTPNERKVLDRTLGHKSVHRSQWPKIKSDGMQELDLINKWGLPRTD